MRHSVSTDPGQLVPREHSPALARRGPHAPVWRAVIARRAMPILAGSAGMLVASLAAERALARVALGAVGRVSGQVLAPRQVGIAARRTVVEESVVVERIRARR